MRLCFDFDGVFCTNTNGQYHLSKPYDDMINLVNKLYDMGHIIIIHTARGMSKSGHKKENISKAIVLLTKLQIKKWGIRCHELHFGKIEADVYVDDKAFRVHGGNESVGALKKFIDLWCDKNE